MKQLVCRRKNLERVGSALPPRMYWICISHRPRPTTVGGHVCTGSAPPTGRGQLRLGGQPWHWRTSKWPREERWRPR
eukprot:3470924-Amphidinium_carterae.1